MLASSAGGPEEVLGEGEGSEQEDDEGSEEEEEEEEGSEAEEGSEESEVEAASSSDEEVDAEAGEHWRRCVGLSVPHSHWRSGSTHLSWLARKASPPSWQPLPLTNNFLHHKQALPLPADRATTVTMGWARLTPRCSAWTPSWQPTLPR